MAKVKVNFKKIPGQSKSFQKKSDDLIYRAYEKNKSYFLEAVSSHPVTQEIEGGPSAQNISNTLGGKGNLFSFIGFDKSQNPIQDLFNALEKTFSISKKRGQDRNRYIIQHPTLEKIKGATKMPWESGNSWTARIERGISGLSNYLYKKSQNSRSGTAIQSKNKTRSETYKRTDYLTTIINNFVRSFNIK